MHTKSTSDDYGAGHSSSPYFYRLTTAEVAQILRTDPEAGLTAAEAQRRLAVDGPNALTEKKTSNLMRFLKQFNNSIIYILIVAAIATFMLREYSDSVVIGMVVIINALIGYFQEVKASSAVDKIKQLLQVEATVVRDGQRLDVPAEDLVAGDLVFLEAGDHVPADLRIVDADNLKIQEAALTGEADSVLKTATTLKEETSLGDRTNSAFASTAVTNGSGLGIVTATAEQTEIGQISSSVKTVKSKTTPLMREINGLGKYISYGIVIVAMLVGIYGYLTKIYSLPVLVIALITMIVGSLPEGLPASTSVVLAMGINKMTKQNAIVKSLPAVETLGSVNVIATDKTGTLTKNEMTVESVVTKQHEFEVTGTGYQPEGAVCLDGQPVQLAEHPDLQKLIFSWLLR